MYKYDIAISYEYGKSDYVDEVYRYLSIENINIFYDKQCQNIMISTDLKAKLRQIYRKLSDICVLFVTDQYLLKENTCLEARAAMSNTRDDRRRLIVVNFTGRTKIDLLPSDIVYIDGRNKKSDEIADIILTRFESMKTDKNQFENGEPRYGKESDKKNSVKLEKVEVINHVENNHGVIVGNVEGSMKGITFHK